MGLYHTPLSLSYSVKYLFRKQFDLVIRHAVKFIPLNMSNSFEKRWIMVRSTFLHDLRTADSEKLVESAYHSELKRTIGEIGGIIRGVSTCVKTDGILEAEFQFNGKPQLLKVIVETKLNETFDSPFVRSRVLAQVVYYLKKLEEIGIQLPNVVLVGDKDECFVLHANYLNKYLNKEYDWTISPSQAGIRNLELVDALIADSTLQAECFIYVINEDFKMNEVIDKVLELVRGIKTQTRITERNISKIFESFSLKILKKNKDGSSKYEAREQVELFMLLVLDTDECFPHPNKKDTALFKSRQVRVNTDALNAFVNHYEFNYNAEEKKHFTAISDRLIEDSDRRRKGDFYTPSIWVDEANKLFVDNIGSDWKDKFVIWDCAWGTGNLTRDYCFNELYCSTLHDHDLTIGEKYNNDSIKFQYDFLNDDVNVFDELVQKVQEGYDLTERDFFGTKLYEKAPNLVKSMLAQKNVLFFINPPFGTTGEMSSVISGTGNKVSGLSDTATSIKMKREKVGACSQQLYAQFLYRILQINKLFDYIVLIGLFSPTLIFTGEHFEWFRENDLKDHFVQGFIFPASDFADVTDRWGISFSLWDLTQTVINNPTKLKVKIFDITGVIDLNDKQLYIVPQSKKVANFYRSKLKKGKTIDYPTLSTAIKISVGVTKHDINSYGYLFMDTPRIEYNNQFVTLIPTKMRGNKIAIPLHNDNVLNCLCLFTARRLITGQNATWVNWQDEYMMPDITHPLYKQWEADCIVYSLFNSKSNFSSLRSIPFNDTRLDIFNHFFFMAKDDIKELSLEHNNDDVYYDVQNYAQNERYIFNQLKTLTLSKDAHAVLEKAKRLVHESFKYRRPFNIENPEYQINTWDAGWYQLKGMLKVYMAVELSKFTFLYKQLEDRMRTLVYDLGFLYK